MNGLSLTDKSLLWQIKLVNTKNRLKEAVTDALFRREEGMEMLQSALLAVGALIATVALFALMEKVGHTFERAGDQLDKVP
jgi:hypothetical protein